MTTILKILPAVAVIMLSGCKKDLITEKDVFNSLQLSRTTAVGDGSQTVGIVCEINPDATEDKLEFVLRTTLGVFTENKDVKLVKKPEFKNGKLVIETTAQVPQNSGTMVISVEPNQPLDVRDFIIKDSVIVSKSVPFALKLQPSVLGIGSNLLSEVLVTGVLNNANGGKVSAGYKVKFEDKLVNGAPANGRFREQAVSSNAESKVSTYYGSVGQSIGTDIWIKASVLDDAGNSIQPADSVLIRIINL